MPAPRRRGGAGDLALGLHHPGEAGRRDPERQRRPAAEHLARGVDRRDVAQDRRDELDVGERLAGPGQRDLAVGGAVGVVEGGLRRTPLGDPAEVVDGQGLVEPALLGDNSGFLNFSSGRGRAAEEVAAAALTFHREAPGK